MFSGLGRKIGENGPQEVQNRYFWSWTAESKKMSPRRSKIVVLDPWPQNRGKWAPGGPKSSFSDLGHRIGENGPQEVQNRRFGALAAESGKMGPRRSKIVIFGAGPQNRRKWIPGGLRGGVAKAGRPWLAAPNRIRH